jgi:3D (Asp-Asp-Asp) domain-containing protein
MRRSGRLAVLFDVSLALATAACASNTPEGAVGGRGDAGDVDADGSSAPADGPGGGESGSDDSSATTDRAAQDATDARLANADAATQDATRQDAAPPEGGLDGAVVAMGDAAGTTMPVYVTFYGWADNSPPGAAIAYPSGGAYPTLHQVAGGTGTYADPITFATDPTEFGPGTRVYVPFIQKYVVMEDSCGQCATDFTTRKFHIDIWMNSSASENASSLISCEDSWTRSQTDIELNPPATRSVTTAPLFDPSTNTCRTTP